jgi:hypothetical protein
LTSLKLWKNARKSERPCVRSIVPMTSRQLVVHIGAKRERECVRDQSELATNEAIEHQMPYRTHIIYSNVPTVHAQLLRHSQVNCSNSRLKPMVWTSVVHEMMEQMR